VLDVLTDTKEKSHHEERQQALLDMLNAGGLDYFDRDHLVLRAKKVGFHRILEMLYEKGQEHGQLLSTYTDDPMRQILAFVFLQKVFLEAEIEASGAGRVSIIRIFFWENYSLLE
jgi:hypothetical protein